MTLCVSNYLYTYETVHLYNIRIEKYKRRNIHAITFTFLSWTVAVLIGQFLQWLFNYCHCHWKANNHCYFPKCLYAINFSTLLYTCHLIDILCIFYLIDIPDILNIISHDRNWNTDLFKIENSYFEIV